MKYSTINIVFACFYFIAGLNICNAADWELFQLNKKSYYKYRYHQNSWSASNLVDLYLADSVVTNLNESRLYFLKKYHGNAPNNCYDQFLSTYKQTYARNPHRAVPYLVIDSLITRDDTVWYNTPNNDYAYFLPNAILNQSWTIHSNYFPFQITDIKITLTSRNVESFLGISDSVKTFSLKGYNGLAPYPSGLDTMTIKLSKNYGLIGFIPFNYLIYNGGTGTPFFDYATLVGTETGNIPVGFKSPTWSDFLNYHQSDILLWTHYVDSLLGSDYTEYFRDSITSANISTDSIIYYFDRTTVHANGSLSQNNGMKQVFLKDLVSTFLEIPTNWFGFGNINFPNNFSFSIQNQPNLTPIFSSSSYSQIINGVDTIINYYILKKEENLDASTCWFDTIINNDFSCQFNTQSYVQYFYRNQFHVYRDYTHLTGAIINGDSVGVVNYLTSVPEIASLLNNITVFPNPAKSIINLTFSSLTSKNTTIELIDILGARVYSTTEKTSAGPFKKVINVGNFKSGIYFLKFSDGVSEYRKKIIVE